MIVDTRSASLEEKVYFTLEEEILSGELEKGEALTEQALSLRLGVSRTPVRGALHRLAEDGLVVVVAKTCCATSSLMHSIILGLLLTSSVIR